VWKKKRIVSMFDWRGIFAILGCVDVIVLMSAALAEVRPFAMFGSKKNRNFWKQRNELEDGILNSRRCFC